MSTTNYVSIYSILERLYRTSAYTKHVNVTDAIELAGEAIDLLGVPTALIEKITDGNRSLGHPQPIKIKDYKGALPTGIKTIIQTRDFEKKLPMSYSGDTFHMAYHCDNSPDLHCSSALKYKVQAGRIHTTFKEGLVEMAYYSYHVDDEGFPLIPDSESYIKGIENYLKYKFYMPLWELGRIPDKVFQKTEQEYLFYMGQAETDAHLQNMDKMGTLKNIIIQLIPDISQVENNFKTLGDPNVRFNNSGY